MAFGGTGGFSFGSNNNNNQSTGFGGFGSSNNTNTGFGASTTNTGFGASTTSTNPFGGGTSTFGSNTGGFGSNSNTTTSLFSKPATTNPFGSTTGTTSLFGGSNNNNSASNTGGFGSGGFGSSTTTGGFGTTNTGTGGGFTFGGNNNKTTGFGSSTTTPLFGQGGAGTTGAFGSTGGFGSPTTANTANQPVGPSDGTASTPFSPTTEKEPNGVTNSYQSITFQQPYQKYSFEELRLADYNAGRQFGNGSGQPGAFGSNAFGGFGSNNTSAFGNTNNANPFGTTTTSASTFGSNTATTGFGGGGGGGGGGLFGNTANKPGGLFGNTAATSSGTTGGLFGTASNTNTGFGNSATGGFGANTGTTGGLFGQNKPATGGLFGGSSGTTNNAFSFGNNNNNAAANTGGGLFGNTNNATNTGGGLFGNNNNNNNTTQNATGGLFGNANNQQGNTLFGNKTGTGFGTQTTQAQTGGLFGASNNNTGLGGGLFGNNSNTANATATGGLFGGGANTGGGLFGNNNNNNNANQTGQKTLFGGFSGSNTNNNTGGGLFGNANNNTNNQQSGGLFNNAGSSTGGFNFGNNNANKPTTSLFGGSTNNQQGGGLFGANNNNNSLFGQSQNNQQSNQQQQDTVKHASLLDPNPYGQSSIWTGLPQPTPENAKPVFTPLTATQKMKESMMKPPPSLRLNQSRYMTPPRRNGFGFSYSTYGTPNSAASTPGGAGLSGSMYGSRGFSGGSFGRAFNKSASVQNLRSQFASDSDDLWKPGAFASSHRNSGGSIKRLTIDRSIRNDLFSRPTLPALPAPEPSSSNNASDKRTTAQTNGEVHHESTNKLKKRVSFENGTSGGLQNSHLNGETGALVRTESDDSDRMDEADGQANGVNGETQSRSKDLAAVPEDRESHHVSNPSTTSVQAKSDPKPGDYWMKPSRAEQSKMSRDQLQNFKDFQVGRQGCGQVTFNSPVDLTALPLDDLYEKIVEIHVRSVTVYPTASDKPPVGKGLNVPSTISVENSWPRSRNKPSSSTSGPVYDKHIQRLKSIKNTEFVSYEPTKGIWTFRVPHYTRYALDYDDDDETELSAPPDTVEKPNMDIDTDDNDDYNEHDDEDDTFAFKQKIVPGGFGRQSAIDYEPKSSALVRSVEHDDPSDQSAYSDEEMSEDEPSMAGSYPIATVTFTESPYKPILKASTLGTPGKPLLDLEGDWAEQLQRTISPRKQNRDILRETQNNVLVNRIYSPIKPKPAEKKDFRTSIDVMNSLFGLTNEQGNSGRKKAKAVEPDFEFPYAKRTKTFDSTLDDMSEPDRKWHESFKTQFTGVGDLIYRAKSMDKPRSQPSHSEEEIVSDRDNAIMKSSLQNDSHPYDLKSALAISDVVVKYGVPYARRQQLPFSYIAEQIVQPSNSQIESDTYALLHILFDEYEDEFTNDLPPAARDQYEAQIRKDRLTKFLSSYIISKNAEKLAKTASLNSTAAAIIRLTANDIKGACDALGKAKNFKLMVLVSQLENASETFQDDVKAQINAWRDQRSLSEISDEIRAIYEICAGNTTICAGKGGNNVPVEDKARTFSIADEFGLDWVQSFALGLWFGREEKRHASAAGVVTIETAVAEFEKRCQSKEESQLPGNDPLWVALKLYAALHGSGQDIEAPVLPTALEALNDNWDASKAFNLHLSIITNIEGIPIDQTAEEELTGLLAYQLSAKGDIAGAAFTLLQLHHTEKREAMLKSLLERFAGQLPDPPSAADANSQNTTSATTESTTKPAANLWTILTQQLHLPESWLYQAKALHARAVSTSSLQELRYLVAAQSWLEAHDCFSSRVAPGIVVDNDIQALTDTVNLFPDDVMQKVPGWEMGGGVYADFALLCTAQGQLNQEAVDGLRRRLVELGRRSKKDVELGKLPVEELEQRVAVQEMSRVVAEKYVGSRKDILELPLTSDQRLAQTVAMAGEYFRGIMAGGSDSA